MVLLSPSEISHLILYIKSTVNCTYSTKETTFCWCCRCCELMLVLTSSSHQLYVSSKRAIGDCVHLPTSNLYVTYFPHRQRIDLCWSALLTCSLISCCNIISLSNLVSSMHVNMFTDVLWVYTIGLLIQS